MIDSDTIDNLGFIDDDLVKAKSATTSAGAQIMGFSVDHDYLMEEQSLDISSWMTLIAIIAGWVIIAWVFPSFSLSYPMFFAPFAYLIYRSRTAQLVLINNTIHNFGMAFAVAPLVLIVLTIFLIAVFPVFDQAGSLFFTLWMIILVQFFFEEFLKYRMIINKVEIDETASVEVRQMQYLDLSRCLFTAMALSLGYGTYQGLSVSLLLAYSSDGLITPIIISIVVAILYIPSHCMSGYLIGLQLARKSVLHENIPAIFIILWPVLFRSIFLFQFLFWAGTNQHPLIAWAVTSVVLTSAFVLYIHYVKKKLPREYLDNAGYNVVLGYIPIADNPV